MWVALARCRSLAGQSHSRPVWVQKIPILCTVVSGRQRDYSRPDARQGSISETRTFLIFTRRLSKNLHATINRSCFFVSFKNALKWEIRGVIRQLTDR